MTKKRTIIALLTTIVILAITSHTHAQGLTVGTNASLSINDGILTTPDNITINGTLQSGAGTINAGGDFINNGVFTSGTGTVNLVDGQTPANIMGTSQFYNLNATTSTGKQINLEAGKTQTVTNSLTFQGSAGNLLLIKSTNAGQKAMINFLGSIENQTIDYVDVMDQSATGEYIAEGDPSTFNSIDSDSNLRWFLNAPTPTIPTLAYSTETGYNTDGVDPDTGDTLTQFTFRALYTDLDNSTQSYIKVHIDGDSTGIDMSLDTSASDSAHYDGNYSNDEQYYYSATLPAGTHYYYFTASDGTGTATLPSSGVNTGPVVTGDTTATSTGSNVQVTPSEGIGVTFNNITAPGSTTVTESGTGTPPPSGYKLGTPPNYYEISTTATFTGNVEVCINYDETQINNENSLKLFHRKNSAWEDITTALNTNTNIICGITTSFSKFLLAEEDPTLISLISFAVKEINGTALIEWETATETDNAGFNIWRSEAEDGEYIKINETLTPAQGSATSGASYSITDYTAQGSVYYYRLEDIDTRGISAFHNITITLNKNNPANESGTGSGDSEQENSGGGCFVGTAGFGF